MVTIPGVRLLLLALLGVLLAAVPASAAFRVKAFVTPTGNIRCVAEGDTATGKDFGMRCDITHHTWTAPKRATPCTEGDYGSSLGMSKRGRARFICVSDAIGPARRVRYGTKFRFGPFRCSIRTTGVRCLNAARHGWFVSRQSVKRF
jgi:uncharacterized protein DUF6636